MLELEPAAQFQCDFIRDFSDTQRCDATDRLRHRVLNKPIVTLLDRFDHIGIRQLRIFIAQIQLAKYRDLQAVVGQAVL